MNRRRLRATRTLLAAIMAIASGGAAAERVIANVAPFSGKLASASRDFNLGLQACVADVNAQGGLGGETLRVVSRDDGQDAASAARLAAELSREHMPLAFVGAGSADAVAAIAAAVPGTPIVAPQSDLPPADRAAGVFSLRPPRMVELERIARHLASLGIRRVALVGRGEASGQHESRQAQRALSAQALELVASAAVAPRSLDVAAAMQAIERGAPQALVALTDTTTTAALVGWLRDAGLATLVVATSATEAEALAALLGPARARGIVIAQVSPSPTREVTAVAREFRALMRRLRLPDERITHGSIGGYLACRVLVQALSRAGPSAATGPAPLARTLASMDDLDIGGFPVDFRRDGRHGSRYVDLSVIGDGGRIRQ